LRGLTCGIVGLPNVGKSTFFKALTQKAVDIANYPFCTIHPNVGVVELHDPRLLALAELSKSQKIVPATVTFVDIAGLVKGASEGEGLGNQFLSHVRETDIIIHIVRLFAEEGVIHVSGKVDPLEDISVIDLELLLSDLQMAENISYKLDKQLKTKKELEPLFNLIQKIIIHLHQNQPVRTLFLTQEERKMVALYPFLTNKKMIYALNVGEFPLSPREQAWVNQIKSHAHKEQSEVVPICIKWEEELSEWKREEVQEYLSLLGGAERALEKLIWSAYTALDRITFFTTGETESRAWPIPKGATAWEAAGEIHTDIQKQFIRAEVIAYSDMLIYKGRTGCREAGKVYAEGRGYVVRDGDIILFYHH